MIFILEMFHEKEDFMRKLFGIVTALRETIDDWRVIVFYNLRRNKKTRTIFLHQNQKRGILLISYLFSGEVLYL